MPDSVRLAASDAISESVRVLGARQVWWWEGVPGMRCWVVDVERVLGGAPRGGDAEMAQVWLELKDGNV
jgi:hypothetical protein